MKSGTELFHLDQHKYMGLVSIELFCIFWSEWRNRSITPSTVFYPYLYGISRLPLVSLDRFHHSSQTWGLQNSHGYTHDSNLQVFFFFHPITEPSRCVDFTNRFSALRSSTRGWSFAKPGLKMKEKASLLRLMQTPIILWWCRDPRKIEFFPGCSIYIYTYRHNIQSIYI